jgi:uncharacterized protein (DUF433 family)
VLRPGQTSFFTLAEVFSPFKNLRSEPVVDFRHPREHLSVDARKMGAWPTIAGTRVTYDTIARLVDDRTVFLKDVPRFYPDVSVEAARDALSFNEQVRAAA